jgi:hypothetical protein
MNKKMCLILTGVLLAFGSIERSEAVVFPSPYVCGYAEPGNKCGNGRGSITIQVPNLSNAILNCLTYATNLRKDFCYVKSNYSESMACTQSGRKWVTASKCCVNYECAVGQYGIGISGPCAACTNKPANAVSVTYTSSGCGENKCNFTSVVCASGYIWNGTSCTANFLTLHGLYALGGCRKNVGTTFLANTTGQTDTYNEYRVVSTTRYDYVRTVYNIGIMGAWCP